MSKRTNKKAFTLTEVLMSMGIFVIGMSLVASVFPLGISLTAKNAEKTVGSLAADKFKADMQILAKQSTAADFGDVFSNLSEDIFEYRVKDEEGRSEYLIAALLSPPSGHARRLIIVPCRKIFENSLYRTNDNKFSQNTDDFSDYPNLVALALDKDIDDSRPGNLLKLDNAFAGETDPSWRDFLVKEAIIIADNTGNDYEIEEIFTEGSDVYLRIDEFLGDSEREDITSIWTVPPAANGGMRSPAISVYETVLNFES
ncbi:type IV pilus modification PilV family protein [Sedimentisphaera salicampi]|uniref:Prepilin-type N-terminal cleavage/methylation domain-containing protein n=1 Tax=Sedimentisphaera salicampi TaxID=1941349 RepID=A0A1W6LPD1_9BACT|nr:prepilin-type N-terminal cleavage/methylation domain-containing protein [Sedimentisphaera salicampi]ARN57634.1 hypothetical protein STSP1_02055 [Sedimentisphaera salicampi]